MWNRYYQYTFLKKKTSLLSDLHLKNHDLFWFRFCEWKQSRYRYSSICTYSLHRTGWPKPSKGGFCYVSFLFFIFILLFNFSIVQRAHIFLTQASHVGNKGAHILFMLTKVYTYQQCPYWYVLNIHIYNLFNKSRKFSNLDQNWQGNQYLIHTKTLLNIET